MKKVTLSEEALQVLVASSEVPEKPEVKAEEIAGTVEEAVDPTVELQASFDAYKVQAEDKENILKASVEAKDAEIAAKVEEISALQESIKAMSDIIGGQLVKMRTALSLGAVDCTKMSAKELVDTYAVTAGQFAKSLPVGGVAKTEEVKKEAAIASSHDASGYKSLGF